ncbi:MAG: CDP-alcohol phosphatidyltransferase family protein [Alphaproteobacteria bacterium]|nr:MAG: CDP-alcohol phosphatidyltransferase family protein [Alphaproteobacteria bacterium]
MLDARIRPLIDPPLNAAARQLAKTGISPNALTLAGFCFGLGAFAALAFQSYTIAALLVAINRVFDGLDGAVARTENRVSDLGGFLDIVTDFIFYAGIVFFFAVGQPETALAAAFLIFSFIGSGVSFLSYAIIAAKRSITTEKQGQKSFFYIGGLMEGTETVIALLLICLLPQYFSVIAIIFGTGCWLTTLGRLLQAFRDLD